MKLLTYYSETHAGLFNDFFLPTVNKYNEYELVSIYADQYGDGNYMNGKWKECLKLKLNYLVEMVQTCWGEYFVYSDVDVVFMDYTKDYLLECVGDADVAFQSDGSNVCAGFFIMKGNQANADFLKKCLDTYESHRNDDQHAMNLHKHMINYKVLPNDFFNVSMILGEKVWNGENILGRIPKTIKMFHANWTIGVPNKINLINIITDEVNK